MRRTFSAQAASILRGGALIATLVFAGPAASAAPPSSNPDVAPDAAIESLTSTSASADGAVVALDARIEVVETANGYTAIGDDAAIISGGADPTIELSSEHGGFTVDGALPSAPAIEDARTLVSESDEQYSVAPLFHADGSVQVTVVIDSAGAPSEYSFDVSTGDGEQLVPLENGAIVILDSTGNFRGGVAPPWAYDANGVVVPTRFEVAGGTITQVIDHASGPFTYPVVADPWLGGNLFHKITVDSYQGQPRVNLTPSTWGVFVWSGAAGSLACPGCGSVGFAAGQAILNSAGWSEAWNWSSTVRNGLNKTSQRQQFECHALGGAFDFAGGGVWNLEKYRPTRTVHWTYGVAMHRCNWVTASQGR